MTDLLIQKLRDAESGSAELDLEIWALAGGWKLVTQPDSIEMRAEKYDGDVVSELEAVAFWDSGGHVRVYHAFEEDLPRYSRSLDAIIGLMSDDMDHWADADTESLWRDGEENENGAYIDLCPCCQLMLDDGWCHECRENMDEYQ